jgi:hypothetical protein
MTEEKKDLSPEEIKERVKEKARNQIFHLSKIDPENREALTFLLSLFDSVYSGSNPNFFRLFKERLMQEGNKRE